MHNLELFFTLSHILPLHDSHINTGFLSVELKANWHEIKPTKWLIKFYLTLTHEQFWTSLVTRDDFSCQINVNLDFHWACTYKPLWTPVRGSNQRVEPNCGVSNDLGCVWIPLICWKLKTYCRKHCSKIIFKCVNNAVAPKFC